nr:hypothetical protein [Salinisphaera orenii]
MNLEANFVPHDGGHFCPELSSFVEALLDDTRQCLEIVEVMPGARVNDIQVDLLIVVDRDVAKADCGLELRLQCRIDQSEVRQAVERFAHRGWGRLFGGRQHMRRHIDTELHRPCEVQRQYVLTVLIGAEFGDTRSAFFFQATHALA